MRVLVLLLFPILIACDSTTPAVMRWERATIVEGGMSFGLHWDRELQRAEAYRTSKHLMPRLSVVSANAAKAIERGSGCKVVPGSIEGDVAILKARIDCG